MNVIKLAEILELHRKWLAGDPAGIRANLTGANLTGANGSQAIGITLITVHLSPYSLTYRSDIDSIHIGCKLLTMTEWVGKEGKRIAKEERFSDAQYKEYMIAIRALRRLSK